MKYITADNIFGDEVKAVFLTRSGEINNVLPELGFSVDTFITVRQVHTDNILTADKQYTQTHKQIPDTDADAIITNLTGTPIGVRTADCVPILMYDKQKKAIAAVHAGWRSTFLQIGTKVIKAMSDTYGTKPADLYIAIGPSVAQNCYEVDFNFYERFIKEFGTSIERFFKLLPGRKPHCDLKMMNKALLTEYGVPEGNISISDYCTCCNESLFYSHRRDGTKRGTMLAVIGVL